MNGNGVYLSIKIRSNATTAGFEVFTAMVMKTSIFWDIMPCSPVKVNRLFEGKNLHLQGLRINQVRNQQEVNSKLCTLKNHNRNKKEC
jgi:hypothetical protein